MRYRVLGAFLATTVALASFAFADFVKSSGPVPVTMPGTLGLTIAKDVVPALAKTSRARSVSCTAGVVDLPEEGPRIVTAKHCVGERLEVFDEENALSIDGHRDAEGDVDVSLLETSAPLPFSALKTRASNTLSRGERLCAFRIEKAKGELSRQQICGQFIRLAHRENAKPMILVRRPFPHGASGSPLVDEDGKVVGIVVATQDEWGLAEPIEAAMALTR